MKGEQRHQCYAIMPFASAFASTYDDAIRPGIAKMSQARGEDWECVRSDDPHAPGSITQEIVTSLHTADLVVADLTDHNPNVFYELGVAHSAGRRTILLAQDVHDLPFDVSTYRVIQYDASPEGLRTLCERIKDAAQLALRSDDLTNPVLDYAPVRHSDLILPLKDVLRLETCAEHEVWLIQPSLDTDLKLFGPIIASNVERGVRYRYLVPNEASVRRQWQRFLGKFGDSKDGEGLFEARFVERHLIESEVVIYDPYSENEEVLLMSPRETRNVFWYRVGQHRGEDIRDRYEALWERAAEGT